MGEFKEFYSFLVFEDGTEKNAAVIGWNLRIWLC